VNVVRLPNPFGPATLVEACQAATQPYFKVFTTVAPNAGARLVEPTLTAFPKLSVELDFWAQVLADLTGCSVVGIRLSRLDSPMCPRFHIDRVTVRLVSTLVGPGTEYVAEEYLNRRWLGHAAGGLADEVTGLLRAGARIEQAETGDIVMLKGETWPGNEGRGAVHRSSHASSAEPRLVLTLDALE
jgi:hypothetical protein